MARPLPRGRRFAPDEVRASQRERLLRAMTQEVAARGDADTTVPRVLKTARVSSNTFYRLFDDKADCFVALCRQLGEDLVAALEVPATPADTPGAGLEALDRALERYLRFWQDHPVLARVYFVELPIAGNRAVDERERHNLRFDALYRRLAEHGRSFDRDAPPVRDIDIIAASIVFRELVAREVRAGHIERLSDLRDDLRYVLLRLLVSDRAARVAAARGER